MYMQEVIDQKFINDMHSNNRNNRNLISFIKIEPFMLNSLFVLLSIVVNLDINEFTYYIINTFFFYSPIMIIFGLARSKLSHLCAYHRLAVLAPIVNYISVLVNDYIYNFSDSYLLFSLIINSVIILTSIYCGIKIFKKNERK